MKRYDGDAGECAKIPPKCHVDCHDWFSEIREWRLRDTSPRITRQAPSLKMADVHMGRPHSNNRVVSFIKISSDRF